MSKDKPETSAAEFFPERKSLKAFREAAADCQACDLWKRGTQTVFGEGARRAEILFVGEQPGNEEDLTGKPFVGPAGRLFDDALQKAGIDRNLHWLYLRITPTTTPWICTRSGGRITIGL